MTNQEPFKFDQSGGTLAQPIRRYSDSIIQETLKFAQSGGTLALPIRRHSGSTNQEALKFYHTGGNLVYQSGGNWARSMRRL